MDDENNGIESFLKVFDDIMNLDSRPSKDDSFGNYTKEYIDSIADEFVNTLVNVLSAMSENGASESVLDWAGDLVVSDMMEKEVYRIANKNEPLTDMDVDTIMFVMGSGDSGLDLSKSSEWDDGMVGKYADCLRNYLYTYRDEAKEIDPTIDPNEEHIGPMAQDIEKVAPDCVKETPEGVKVVDGNRLALVNAGVIGDLSREVLELRGRLAALEAKNG